MNIRKIRLPKSIKSNLGPKVADILRNAILQGEFKSGERINETLVSSNLGISKSPVREAIRILESDNLVETHDRRGTFVRELSVKEIEETYVVMKLINVAAARLAATNMNEKRKNELASILKQMEKISSNDDIQEMKPLSMRWHTFIIKASENSLLLRIHNNLLLQQERFRMKGKRYEANEIKDIVSEHIAISKALLKQDVNEAESLMINHVENARQRVINALKKEE